VIFNRILPVGTSSPPLSGGNGKGEGYFSAWLRRSVVSGSAR